MGDKALSWCVAVEAWPASAGTGGAINTETLFGWWWPSFSGKELLAGF